MDAITKERLEKTTTQLMSKQGEQVKSLEQAIKMSKKIILAHNYIVEVGAYTIGTKFNKELGHSVLEYQYKDPHNSSQWNKEGVEQIKRILTEEGEDREIKVYFYKDFYKEKLELLKECIESNKRTIEYLNK